MSVQKDTSPALAHLSMARKLREVCELLCTSDTAILVKYVSLLLWLYQNDRDSRGISMINFVDKGGATSAVQVTRFCKYFSGDIRKRGQSDFVGWVSVTPNPENGREKLVKLTATGKRKVEHLLSVLES